MGNIYDGDWQFNKDVAEIFDDHVMRSVPFYTEVHHLICDIISNIDKKSLVITDVGTSTAELIFKMQYNLSNKELRFIGIDNSEDMLLKAKAKCAGMSNVLFVKSDIEDYIFTQSDIIVSAFTLQFTSINRRFEIIKNIYNSLTTGGYFILCEKIKITNFTNLDSMYISLHEKIKERNGFSEEEILRKKESLKNVMFPVGLEYYIDVFRNIGFSEYGIFFKCLNFVGLIAIK